MEEENEKIFEGKWYAYPPIRNALIAGLLTGLTFGLGDLEILNHVVEISIYTVSILIGGYYWMKEGVEDLFTKRKIGIEILMMAATIGACILNFWNEAAFLVFIYALAEGFEGYTFAKTRTSIRKLLDLAPKMARIIRNGKEETIPAEEIKVGDIFIVKPGESLPTDGIIIKGKSFINQAPVTGESIPVEKKEGMKVFAATMNQEGSLEVRTTAAFKDNTLSKMIHLVEEAHEQKGKRQLFIEKFGNNYSPVVLLAALLMIVMPLLLNIPVAEWASKAVVLLVAAAPCALVMSTPIAIAAGIGKAGRSGILIKGGAHLENLGNIKAVALDKTGTLTSGKPVVTDIVSISKNENEILQLAYSIERFSEHPLARAIVNKAEETGLNKLNAIDFSAIIGKGAKATIEGQIYYVGKPEMFMTSGQNEAIGSDIERLRKEGKTVIVVGTDKIVHGIIAIRDEVRAQAKEVIAQLHNAGIKVVMLTGDNDITANAIARELNIDDVRANLKPEDKIEAIISLEAKFGAVAMVGDGINDAPALARSTVGIAMGVAGTDAAIEAADVALMADDLTKLLEAIKLGKKAKAISIQNIVFSLLILAVLIPSAIIGIMGISVAVLFHEVSELIAVANGLRAARL